MNQSELKAILNYDPETGLFTWRINSGQRARIGGVVGTFSNGYRRLRYKGKHHLLHRLAFLYMTGKMPDQFVDHINGIRDDNRWANLRQCEFADNTKNAKLRSDNTTGAKGVSVHNGKYRARIRTNGKRILLGNFNTLEEARLAYAAASQQEHGEFSRLS